MIFKFQFKHKQIVATNKEQRLTVKDLVDYQKIEFDNQEAKNKGFERTKRTYATSRVQNNKRYAFYASKI